MPLMIDINNIHGSFPTTQHLVSLKNSVLLDEVGYYARGPEHNRLDRRATTNIVKIRRLEETLNKNRFQTVIDVVSQPNPHHPYHFVPFAFFKTEIKVIETDLSILMTGLLHIGKLSIYFERLSQSGNIYCPVYDTSYT